jgi:type IV pilus assembly protein PilC
MRFLCRYGTEDGSVETRVITAETKEAAVNILKKENIVIYEVRPHRTAILSLLRKKKRIKRDEFLIMLRELIALLGAGLPLLQSLDILTRRRKDEHFLSVLNDIRENIKSGSSLADSFRAHEEFSGMFTALIETGEKSGELPKVLERYLVYTEKFDEMRKKLLSALIYPAILIVLSFFLILIMLTFVIPRFIGFYENSEKNLPVITRVLISFSSFVSHNIIFILAGILIITLAFKYWKSTENGRLHFDRAKLRVPIVGQVWHKHAINQFCRSLSVMLKAGIPLLSALLVTTKTITNKWLAKNCSSVIYEVNEGDPLYSSLEKTGMFPDIAVEMIQVGEQTGSLESMLNQLADYYDREIDLAIDRMLRSLEPIFLIIMGMIIAGMLLAMYLPIFKAGSMIL